MSTNNFKFENILIVAPDFNFDNRCLDEECEHFEEDWKELGVSPTCEHVDTLYEFDEEGFRIWKNEVREAFDKLKTAKNIYYTQLDTWDNDRSYNGHNIYKFVISSKNRDIYKEVYIVVRAGYYDGANIDYKIEDIYDFAITKTEKALLDKQVEVLCKKIEKVLRTFGEEYLKVGQFSNGEVVYKKK